MTKKQKSLLNWFYSEHSESEVVRLKQFFTRVEENRQLAVAAAALAEAERKTAEDDLPIYRIYEEIKAGLRGDNHPWLKK